MQVMSALGTIPAATDRHIAMTTTAQQMAAANAARTGFVIVNDTAVNAWIRFGAAATATPGNGNIKIPPGGRYEMPLVVDIRAISIIGEGAGNITATEYV